LLSKKEVMELLRKNQEKLRALGVKRLGIFGSVARGEATEESDIDFVVEFEEGKATYQNFMSLVDFLEKICGKKVDLLTPYGIETIRIPFLKEAIKQEIEYV